MEFDYLVVYVEDLQGVADWYREHLGFPTDEDTQDFIRVRDDAGFGLGIHRGEPLEAPGRIQLHFRVEDVDATHERLTAAGVAFDGPPRETPWGHRVATTADPAGHTAELVTVTE